MPWCGPWVAGSAYGWVMPLIGLVFMGVMLFLCFRGFGCMGGWSRRRGHGQDSRRTVEGPRR